MTNFQEQVYRHLESERMLEDFLGGLLAPNYLELAELLQKNYTFPPIDTVITALGNSNALAFAVALKLKARLVVVQDRPYKYEGVYASEIDDRILFGLQSQLEGIKNVLIVQDFLRHGYTPIGIYGLVAQAGGKVVGYQALIEYSNLGGRNRLEIMNVPVEVLAQVAHTPRGLQPERRNNL